MDKELLKLLFYVLDVTQYECPLTRDIAIEHVSKLYNKTLIDTTNCFLDYTWSEIDKVDGDKIIDQFVDNI